MCGKVENDRVHLIGLTSSPARPPAISRVEKRKKWIWSCPQCFLGVFWYKLKRKKKLVISCQTACKTLMSSYIAIIIIIGITNMMVNSHHDDGHHHHLYEVHLQQPLSQSPSQRWRSNP